MHIISAPRDNKSKGCLVVEPNNTVLFYDLVLSVPDHVAQDAGVSKDRTKANFTSRILWSITEAGAFIQNAWVLSGLCLTRVFTCFH